jgi:hypothetical protein
MIQKKEGGFYTITLNGKEIDVYTELDKRKRRYSVSIDTMKADFDNLKEFTYFINMLTDLCQDLKAEEDEMNFVPEIEKS